MFLFELFDLQNVLSIFEERYERIIPKDSTGVGVACPVGIASGLSVALGESFTITYHSEGVSEIAPATYQSGEESVEPVWP